MERRLAEQVATIWWVVVTTISITTTFAIITIAITIMIVFITLVVVAFCISPE